MEYLTIPADPNKYFVLFHGTGGNEYNRLEQAGDIDPYASVISFLGDEGTGKQRCYFKLLENGALDRENLDQKVTAFLKQWDSIKPEHATLTFLGYSNGANFILGLLEQRPDIADNVILLHPSNLDYHFSQGAESKVFLTIGASDTLSIPADGIRLAKQIKEVYPNTDSILLDTGHEITLAEIEKVKEFLKP